MNFTDFIRNSGVACHPVVKFDEYIPLDLSKDNSELAKVDLNNESSFTGYIFNLLQENDKLVGVGGYAEERSLYSRSDLFEGEEPRTIHLGIDIWSAAGTEVYAPIAGVVHSFANRNIHGDYGPVIILEHSVKDKKFYTLYGHLSLSSLDDLHIGKKFAGGEKLAEMGSYEENFHWPPHLHFQVMWDIQGYEGDYPGVCRSSEKDVFLSNCPDPAILLHL